MKARQTATIIFSSVLLYMYMYDCHCRLLLKRKKLMRIGSVLFSVALVWSTFHWSISLLGSTVRM